MSASECVVKLGDGLTYREAKYVKARIEGKTERDALRAAGFSEWVARVPNKVSTIDELRAVVTKCQSELAENTIQCGLFGAIELHEQLTDQLRGDIAELYGDDGELLPVKDWPLWARQGGVEFVDEPNMVHSADDGGGSWDAVGRKIRIIAKDRTKKQELVAKLKSVNAITNPNDKLGEGLSDVAKAIDSVISEGRRRAAERNRLLGDGE